MTHNLGWQDDKPRAPMPIRMELWEGNALDALAWAPRAANGTATFLAKLTIYGLTPLCAVVWLVERFG